MVSKRSVILCFCWIFSSLFLLCVFCLLQSFSNYLINYVTDFQRYQSSLWTLQVFYDFSVLLWLGISVVGNLWRSTGSIWIIATTYLCPFRLLFSESSSVIWLSFLCESTTSTRSYFKYCLDSRMTVRVNLCANKRMMLMGLWVTMTSWVTHVGDCLK